MSATSLPKEEPLVTIITPVFNGANYIESLIDSVQSQQFISIEHIVIDDGSTDDSATINILKKHQHIKWWTQDNAGQYPTLNRGIMTARGKWICIISADDLLASSDAMSSLIKSISSNEVIDGVFGRTILVNEQGESVREYGRPNEASPIWINKYYLLIHHCSLLVSRDFIIKNSLLFDEKLKYAGDWDWVIRILKRGRLKFVDIPVSKYRLHSQQTRQSADINKLKAEDILVLKKNRLSLKVHYIIIGYYRLKKIISIICADGLFGLIEKINIYKNK